MIERVIIPNRSFDQFPSETQSRLNLPVHQSIDQNDPQLRQGRLYVDELTRVKQNFKVALERLIQDQNQRLHGQGNQTHSIYVLPAPVDQQCYQLYVQFKHTKQIPKAPQTHKDRSFVMHSLDSKLQYSNFGMEQFSQGIDLVTGINPFGLRQQSVHYSPIYSIKQHVYTQFQDQMPSYQTFYQQCEPYLNTTLHTPHQRFVGKSYDALHNQSFHGYPPQYQNCRGSTRTILPDIIKQDRDEKYINYTSSQEKQVFVQPQRSAISAISQINKEKFIRNDNCQNKQQQQQQTIEYDIQIQKNDKEILYSEEMSSWESDSQQKVLESKKNLTSNKQQQNTEELQKKKLVQSSDKLKKQKKISKLNDTKNITKNYSKAIISYIIQNKDLGMKILDKDTTTYEEFISMLKQKKNQMTNIKELRNLWTNKVEDPKILEFNRAFRTISKYFIQHQSIAYVYNSRISNVGWHLKYRYNLLRALNDPQNFKYIKDI